jgi:hypothetical protein
MFAQIVLLARLMPRGILSQEATRFAKQQSAASMNELWTMSVQPVPLERRMPLVMMTHLETTRNAT